MNIRVLICDELPVVRDGMRTMLDAMPDIEVVDTTDNGMAAIMMVRTIRPDVVITDLELHTISGLDMIRRMVEEERPSPNIVVFTRTESDTTVRDALHAGAIGLLGKDASPQEIITAVRLAAEGRTMLAPDIAHRLVTWFREQPDTPSLSVLPSGATTLTRRELEVTRLVARGMATDEVARSLTIGVATVRTHLYRVSIKLGARDRAQLVSLAYRYGLMHSPPTDQERAG